MLIDSYRVLRPCACLSSPHWQCHWRREVPLDANSTVLAGSAAWAIWREWWLTGLVAHLVALHLHGWRLQRRAFVISLKWLEEVWLLLLHWGIYTFVFYLSFIILYYIVLNNSIQMQGFFDGFEGLQAHWCTLRAHTHDLVYHAFKLTCNC